MWIITLLAHLFCNTGYNTILRHATADKKIDPLFLAAVMSTAVAAPGMAGIFIVNINWSLFDARIILLFITAIATSVAFHICNAKALENTEASVFSFLYNFRIGFVTLLGIGFFSEQTVPLRLVGGALVFAAGLILSGKSTSRPAGVMFSILTAAFIAILNAFDKYLILQLGYAGYMFTATTITAGILWLIVLGSRRGIDKPFLKTGEFRTLMIIRCISGHGFTLSLRLGALLSVSTYISALTCVTTPIAAIIFLKETDSLQKKIIAGIVALAGVTLIFLTNR